MAIKKIQMIPPGYTDQVYPETTASAVIEETNKKFMTDAERTKLTNIQTNAQVNNISDSNASLLTSNGNTSLHYHSADRDRSNHSGTQLAATISDFAATVRATALTGLSTATNAVITVTDTVLTSLGKLQKQISDNLTTLSNHTGNTTNPHNVTKSQVGLGNVDNTSDANKPISTAQQTALDLKAPLASPALTGTPTAPTAVAGTNTTQVATTAFVKTAIDNKTSVSGNAGTATKLATARTIGTSGGATGTATSFDGTANITIPITSLDATKLTGLAAVDTSGNAATATKLATARSIGLSGDVTGSVTFDGSTDATIAATVGDDSHNHTSSTITDFSASVRSTVLTGLSLITNAAITATDTVLTSLGKLQKQITDHLASNSNPHNVTKAQVGLGSVDNTADSAKNVLSASKLTTARTINGTSFDGTANITITAAANGGTSAACSGNAATATKLQTARTINGVSFDGTANITIADSTKLPVAGGTLTGILYAQANTSYTTRQVRNTIQSTAAPSGGSNGDVWHMYE